MIIFRDKKAVVGYLKILMFLDSKEFIFLNKLQIL